MLEISDSIKSLKEALRQALNGSEVVKRQADEVLGLITLVEKEFKDFIELSDGENAEEIIESLEERIGRQLEAENEKLKTELELTKTTLANILREISEREDGNQIKEVLRQLSRKIEDPDACLTDKHILSIALS